MQLIYPEPKEAQIAHLQTEHCDSMYWYLFSGTGGLILLSHGTYGFFVWFWQREVSQHTIMKTFLLVLDDIYDSFGWYPVTDWSSECRVHLQGNIPDTYTEVRKRSTKICVIEWMSCSAWCYLRSFISYEMSSFVNPSSLLELKHASVFREYVTCSHFGLSTPCNIASTLKC